MSSLTGRGERFPGLVRATAWDTQAQHHGDFSTLRPAPEGSRDDTLRNTMCQRSSYKSLPGYGVGERASNMSYGTGTLCRSTVSALTGLGRAEQKVTCCEKCSTTLLGLKKQALSLAVHQQFSCKDSSDLSSFLHDNLRVHSRPTDSWERGECSTCGTSVNELKQEAVFLALNRGQVPTRPPFEPSFGPPFTSVSLRGQLDSTLTRYEDRPSRDFTRTLQHFRSRTHSPLRNQCSPQNTRAPSSPKTPQRTPQTLRRRGAKSPHRDMDRWVEEQKQQLVSSKSTLPRARHQTADKSSGDAGAVQMNSKLPHITRVVTIANTAAMSFLAKAAEKLNLTLRKKGHASDSAPAQFSTCFRDVIQKNPPAAPSCLLQAATRTKDSPNVGKVRVVLRVNPDLSQTPGPPSVLQVDSSRRRVTVMEPFYKGHPYSTLTLGRDKSLIKTFNFDATYPQHASQADLCAGVLPDVIRCVLSGSDGCVLALGCSDVGSWSSMVGSDDSTQKLGLIPCAISWLFSAIERRREKTWTDLSVSVSALELCCGEEDTLRDLLGEMLPTGGNIQDSPTAHIKLQEDPVCGVQVRNHNRVKAPTAERAASLLDAAITARRHTDFVTYLSHSSIMFFTLHVQPPRTETSTLGKGSRGPTKLTLIDVCRGMRFSKNRYPYTEVSPIVLSLLNGQRTIPNKSSKLSLLLRESLGHVNCHTVVVAQVSDSMTLLDETLSTIQTAVKIRRTQRREKSGSCSPHARSLTREKKAPKTLSLRAFHSTEEVDSDVRPLRFRGRLYDDQSGSEQSCDTVIQIDSKGLVQANTAPRVNQPEFVPIIPSLHPSKTDIDDPEFTALLKELLKIPQLHGDKKKQEAVIETLKCDTFAELQERLGCIDGSELTAETLKLVQNAVKLEPVKNNVDINVSKVALLNQNSNQKPGGEADAAFSGDSFQREDSGLYDCEECSAASSGEELLNQTLTRNATRRSENHKNNKKTEGPSVACQSKDTQDSAEGCEWIKPDKRASPIGKSNSPSTSCPNSHTASVVLGDVLSNVSSTESKAMKATITVTVKQPLDQKGQDEIVFSMVEEVTISGGMSSVSTTGNIICFQNASQNGQHGGGGSQPIRIISNVMGDDASATSEATPKEIVRPEKGSLPSFINPMLMSSDIKEESECANKKKEKHSNGMKLERDIKKKEVKCKEHSKPLEAKSSSGVKDDSKINSTDSKTCTKMPKSPEKSQPTDVDNVCANNSPKTSQLLCPVDEITPKRTAVAPGCQGTTTSVVLKSGTLPKAWQDSKVLSNDSQLANRKDPREVTSSTPGSPRVTLDKWEGRQYCHTNQDASFTPKKALPSLFESGRSKSPFDDTSRLFSVKLEQLVSRTNSLERNPRDFPIFEHGSSSTTSVSSKSSSDGAGKSYCVYSEGDYTLPRTSRSSKKSAKIDQNYATVEYGKQSKLSAKDKLKIASPKVRRQSAPTIKNMSLPHKNFHQSPINRSASLSPDGKTVSFERMSTFLSSSPPRSHQSLSRTPSQSSTCSSSKSAIQGFVTGTISDLLKDRSGSPSSLDQMGAIPSPYSQVTAPRLPSPNGYASDTTSVLSGDLPPAMGKTSLYFSNRNSTVSSGYGSMLRERDSEASDRSASGLSAGRNGRSSKKRSTTGVHQRRQHESTQSLKRSTNGARSRFVEHEIPEAYEIKVYDIDHVQRTQKRSGPSVFQCQAEVFGASSEEDLRGAVSHRPHGGARGGQTLQHITAHHVEPRGGAFTDLRGHRGS